MLEYSTKLGMYIKHIGKILSEKEKKVAGNS